jgi:hypothetical protein
VSDKASKSGTVEKKHLNQSKRLATGKSRGREASSGGELRIASVRRGGEAVYI